jgi:hypothetical protein
LLPAVRHQAKPTWREELEAEAKTMVSTQKVAVLLRPKESDRRAAQSEETRLVGRRRAASGQTASQGAAAVLVLFALTKTNSSGRGRSLIVFSSTSSTSSKWVKFVVGSPAAIVSVRRTVSEGEVVEFGKTNKSRRQVPLSRRALEALDRLPPQTDTPLLFPSARWGVLNLSNFRRREWGPAIKASGVAKPARIYALRSTFASNALAAGVTVFELARVMGTSVAMIERQYGALLDGAHAGIAGRLDALEAELEQQAAEAEADV